MRSDLDLLTVLHHPAAMVALRCYYHSWSGRRFESIGRDGFMIDHPDVITATDIVAVSLLNVRIRPKRIIDLLEGSLGSKLRGLLAGVPTDVDLGTADAAVRLEPNSDADQAWHLLCDHVGGSDAKGKAWVTAGKLLARKRPRLIPVYDDVIRCMLRPSDGESYWLWLNCQLQQGSVRDRLQELHQLAELPRQTTIPRVVDVILWMFHQKGHAKTSCNGFQLADVPAEGDCSTWSR